MSSESIGAIEFEFTAENINNLKQTDSDIVYVRGLPWFIRVQKVIQGKQVPSIGVYLISDHEEKRQNWAMIACATIELLSSKVNRPPHKVFLERSMFSPKRWKMGNDSFISYTELIDLENGFVDNDTCLFRIKIESGQLQNFHHDKNLGIEPDRKYYGIYRNLRLKFNKINYMFGECSPEIMLAQSPWQISVVKNDSQIDGDLAPIPYVQIQLYNGFADDEKNWSCRATLKCKLFSSNPAITTVQSIVENVKFDTKKTFVHLNFISWEKFVDPLNKFIENDSCLIQIQIAIYEIEGFPKTTPTIAKPVEPKINEAECPICFESLINRPVYSTFCGHVFCGCVFEAFRRKRECPKCQKPAPARKFVHRIFLPEFH